MKPSKWLEQRKPMTIVAGFPGMGFVVLAADSEEGGGIAKSSVHKIATVDKGDAKLLIGGAGHGDFIDLAVQHADESITKNDNLKSIRQKLETIVTEIYSKRIDHYPEHERSDLEFGLLCALWSKKDTLPQLVRVRRSACLIRKAPEAIGIGTYLARYLIATLGDQVMDADQIVRLAAYVIGQAKKYVNGCGGATQVLAVGMSGEIHEMPESVISQHEMSTELVVEDVGKVIFYATDPMKTEFDGDKIREALDAGMSDFAGRFATKLISRLGLPPQLLLQHIEQASVKEVQSDPQPTTPDPSPQPPSQE